MWCRIKAVQPLGGPFVEKGRRNAVPFPARATTAELMTVALRPMKGALTALGFRHSSARALFHRLGTRCRACGTGRSAPAQLLSGETAIRIFVQALQGLARVGDFAGIDDPVVIGVQRCYHERRRRLGALSGASWAGGSRRRDGLRLEH